MTLLSNMMLCAFVGNKLLHSLHNIERDKLLTMAESLLQNLSGVIGSVLCQDSMIGSLNVHSI